MDHKFIIGNKADKPGFTEIRADASGQIPSRIHVMSVGSWHAPWHGDFEMTPADLAEMVVHFEEGEASVEGSKKLPINYGHDISGKAAGWITGLSLENNGNELWADVEWTPEGQRMLADGELKYISPEWNPRSFPYQDPEDSERWLNNVFTGAGLTNVPLFKKLKPVMASITTGSGDKSTNKGGDAVNLAEILGKKPEDRSDEEKAFLVEHKDELTDEQRQAEGLTDGESEADKKAREEAEAAKADADAKAAEEAAKSQQASVNAGLTPDQVKQLQADAAAGREAQRTLLRNSLTASMEAGVKRGVIKSDQLEASVEMLMELPEANRAKVLSFVDNLPDNKLVASELGSGSGVQTSAQDELMLLAEEKAKADNIPFNDALKRVMASNSDLTKRVEAERKQ